MKPARYKYFDPETKQEALGLLREFGSDSKILAGGQSLLPMMNLRVFSPEIIVDINRVSALSGFNEAEEGSLCIGALTRQRMIEDSLEIATHQPLVAKAIPLIAHRAIRCRGTVGGSLSHADPSAEWGALVLALDATLVCESAQSGIRRIAANDFFVDVMETELQPDELLTEIRLPIVASSTGHGFAEFSRRSGDLALAGAACVVTTDKDGHCLDVKLAIFGVEAVPRRLVDIETRMVGEKLGERAIELLARLAADDVDPLDDPHTSAEYRRQLTRVVVKQAVAQAQ